MLTLSNFRKFGNFWKFPRWFELEKILERRNETSKFGNQNNSKSIINFEYYS